MKYDSMEAAISSLKSNRWFEWPMTGHHEEEEQSLSWNDV